MAAPVGILGGTFDPVHHGHLRLAVEVYQACGLAEVRLIPVFRPPHRSTPEASAEQRLQMLRLAVNPAEGLRVDDRELQRGDVSFTVDTLRSLREEVGQQPLCLILGMDAFQKLDTWHQWTSLLEYAHIILARRPGTETNLESKEVAGLYNSNLVTELVDLHTQEAGKILNVDIAELDISSTRIRELIRANRKAHYLLPETVISYIEQEGLYHRH